MTYQSKKHKEVFDKAMAIRRFGMRAFSSMASVMSTALSRLNAFLDRRKIPV